jgi:hypothetical protein
MEQTSIDKSEVDTKAYPRLPDLLEKWVKKLKYGSRLFPTL